MLGAARRCFFLIRTVALTEQIALGYAAINDIPRQPLVLTELTVGIEGGINTCTFKDAHPLFIAEIFVPRIEHHIFLCRQKQGL